MQRSHADQEFLADIDILDEESSNADLYIEGDTLIHCAFRSCQSATHFFEIIRELSESDIIDQVLTPNDANETVFDIDNESLSSSEFDFLRACLLAFALKKTIIPMNQQVLLDQYVQEYKLVAGTELCQNFADAVYLFNLTRSKITYSTSHPQMNGMPAAICQTELRKMEAYRENFKHRALDIYLQEARFKATSINEKEIVIECDITAEANKRIAADESNYTYQGNCLDMAAHAYFEGQKRGIETHMYRIKNGDHVFLVIGKFNSFLKVTCDVWSGVIGLFSETHKLGAYKPVAHNGMLYNLILNLTDIHQIEPFSYYGLHTHIRFTADFSSHFADTLIKPIIDQLASERSKLVAKKLNTEKIDKELFLFAYTIKYNLKKALDTGAIDEAEVTSWTYLTFLPDLLKQYFSSDITYIPSIMSLYGHCEPLFHRRLQDALTNKVDPNQTNKAGITALFMAVAQGYTATVNMLLEAGANQNLSIKVGETPIYVAALFGREDIIDLLLVKPNTKLTPITNSADYLLKMAEDHNPASSKKMSNYILLQIAQGKLSTQISITPQQIAEIMGYDSIAFKLQKYASMQLQTTNASTSQCTVFSQNIVMQESEDSDCGVNDNRFAINNG